MDGGRIVVGVDGSPGSERALAWAVSEARLRHATLEVVHTWRYPYSGGFSARAFSEDGGSYDELREAYRRAAADVLNHMVAAADAKDVEVVPELREGRAAEVLIARSEGADLLVVGSRGRGGFTGLLLGSVGQHCVQHAACPVTVVRDHPPG